MTALKLKKSGQSLEVRSHQLKNPWLKGDKIVFHGNLVSCLHCECSYVDNEEINRITDLDMVDHCSDLMLSLGIIDHLELAKQL